MKRLVTGVLVGALAVVATASPAEGAVPGRGGSAGRSGLTRETVLRLTLTYPSRNTSGTRMVTLKCDPPGGNHPAAEQACKDLAAHHGAFDHRPDRNQVCPMIYQPVVARATGRWQGRYTRFRKQYGNDCIMRSRTGSVFSF